MTPEQIGEKIGIVTIIAIIIYIIYLMWKYNPVKHLAQMAYDLRYFVIQVVLMYSNKPSIFSIKRFHSGLILYWAIITASLFIRKRMEITPDGLMIIITPLLMLGGYNLYQSQQDKRIKDPKKEDEPENN